MATPTRKALDDGSPGARKRPRLSDEQPIERLENVARTDSFSDGFFGSEIDFDDEALQTVDEYDVFQPEPDVDVTCVVNSGDDPFVDGADPRDDEDKDEVPSSQGEADSGGAYTIGEINEDDKRETDIDFSALVQPAVGISSAPMDISYSDSMPTFVPASQVPIDRSELPDGVTFPKPVKRLGIQLAGGAGGLVALTEEQIKASAEKLMAYQRDTGWKPQPRVKASDSKAVLGSQAFSPLDEVEVNDSGVDLLEPVTYTPGSKSKGKRRASTPPARPTALPASPLKSTPRSTENLKDPQSKGLHPPSRSADAVQLNGSPFHRFISSFKTPVRPAPGSRFSTTGSSTSTGPTAISLQAASPTQTSLPSQTAPSVYRLGLSRRKPKSKFPAFTTPFKPGMAPGENGREALDASNSATPRRVGTGRNGMLTPAKPATPAGGSGMSGITRALEAEKERQLLEKAVFDIRRAPDRKSLREAGVVPLPDGKKNSVTLENIPYLTLKSASEYSFPQGGHTAALTMLHERGCALATKEWAKNHWGQVVWKLAGMARTGAEETNRKWNWEEASKQMLYRYEREINRAERPAIRLVQEHDASPAQAMVLCVSDIQFHDNDEVEIELTDGWYRIRTVSDKTLARAARKGKIAVGRKIGVAGAKLEGSHEGKEVLRAYASSALKIGGNSTSLAPWDARLGFQPRPFIASLRSLTADGGPVALLDVQVLKLFPVGFVETDQTGRSSRPCDQSGEDEAHRAWEERRTNEASKWHIQFEKQLERMKAAVSKLGYTARGIVPSSYASPPHGAENFLEELEDSQFDLEPLKARRSSPAEAAWLASAIQAKCDELYERREEEMERELASICPPRKVRNFRVVVIKDAGTLRRPTGRRAQLTVWDVLSFGDDTLRAGQRYLISGCSPKPEYVLKNLAQDQGFGRKVLEALELLTNPDESEGQQALSVIADRPRTLKEVLASPEEHIRITHGCMIGGGFDFGFCQPLGGGPRDIIIVYTGSTFFVLTVMIPILDAASGGRVTPHRLWRLALPRGHFNGNRYAIKGVNYGIVEKYWGLNPWPFGELSVDDIRALEDKGTPEEIADIIRARGFWMWMRPDRFPIDVTNSPHAQPSPITLTTPRADSDPLTSILKLPPELTLSICVELALYNIIALAAVNKTLYTQLLGSLDARDALARAYMRSSARWCLPHGEAELKWWNDRNGDDTLGWEYMKRCYTESHSMRNRRRIWRAVGSIENECEKEEMGEEEALWGDGYGLVNLFGWLTMDTFIQTHQ
ncbi:hypothetical protein FRC10_005015 [Ceratobasidium sp. 414]|nr:hypothetical protein FRC10_005015 [Ceratobasidium sp. 414]